MKTLITTGLGALEIAGSLCGVPFVGAAAIILKDIANSCDEVRTHKRKSRQLSNNCAEMLTTLVDHNLEGSALQEVVDEVEFAFQRIKRRLTEYSRYTLVKAYIKNNEIGKGLDQCEIELRALKDRFQIKAQLVLDQNQREQQEQQQANHMELKQMLDQIMSSRNEMNTITKMQNPKEVAQMLMHDGQTELRNLRFQPDPVQIAPSARPSTQAMPPQPKDSQRYLEYQRGLMMLHRITGALPSVKTLNGEITKNSELAIAGGTYSDIWLGTWLGEEKVALKALRNIKASDARAQSRFIHEITVWANLKNLHILPFYGIVTDLGQHIHTVSPWQENGNVLEFVRSHPDSNRLRLICGAAEGLEYLHSRNIIHGNMKCANILVSAQADACICDFGMSKVIEEVTEKTASATLTASGSARWLAPELIDGTVSSPTMAADTYSYAMAILELLTGKHPFSNRKRDASVIHDIVVLRKTPLRPMEPDVLHWLTDELWALMQKCWQESRSRPAMSWVLSHIQAIKLHSTSADTIIEEVVDAMDTSS